MPWWKSLFPKRSRETQLDAELRFHIDEMTEANIAAGLAPEEARRQAMIEFGGREQIKEELRDVHRLAIVDNALAHVKSALRFMRKSPSFSLAVVLTLALGIGANSVVFSAIDAILLRPLPFPEGDRLMRLDQSNLRIKAPGTFVAPVRLGDWDRMNATFRGISGYYEQSESETTGPFPEKLTRALVAPRFLQVLGVAPVFGRDFSPDEERSGGPSAVLISDRFWRSRFGGDRNVVGRTLRLSGYSNTIIGVMPASFRFPDRDVDLWSAVPFDAPFAQSRDATWFTVIGRLKPGVSVSQAQADLTTVQSRLGREFPKPDADLRVQVLPLKETTVGGVRKSLMVLYGSVSLLLLIACTNIAALLLSRATQRQHEIAIRFSLGASRASVVMQLLTEAFGLAFVGAGLGLVVASGTSRVFRTLARDLPRIEEIGLDWRLVLYTLASVVAATMLCAMFPAIRATRRGLSGSLSQASRTQVSARNPLQLALVGVQVAMAVALLAGAGLLLRSFQMLGQVSPGFDASHVLTLRISAGYGETADMKGLTQRIDRTLDSLRAVPGVEAAATSSGLPGVPDEYAPEMNLLEAGADPARKIVAESRFVSPGYLATVRIPLLAGESCRATAGPPGVLVNRSFADTYLPRATVIGRHLAETGNAFLPPGEIRGIVGDARETGINVAPVPTVYWCFSAPGPDPYFLVRTHGQPASMAQTLRRAIHKIEPARSVFDVMPLGQHLSDAFAENRLRTILLAFFALTAVSLASMGLYGMLSYFVTVRRRETGLRLALGALRGQILRQFLSQGLGVTLLGSVAGLGLAAASAHLLSGMLYGVSPSDTATLAGVILLTILVAAIASLVPAIRAARVEPMQVLREE
jgi:putative ABC transport system permease protein